MGFSSRHFWKENAVGFFSIPEARIMRFFNRDDDRFFESAGDEERRKKAIAQLTGRRNALFVVDFIYLVSWILLPLLSGEPMLWVYSGIALFLLYETAGANAMPARAQPAAGRAGAVCVRPGSPDFSAHWTASG
jgi:hypothetical protein